MSPVYLITEFQIYKGLISSKYSLLDEKSICIKR